MAVACGRRKARALLAAGAALQVGSGEIDYFTASMRLMRSAYGAPYLARTGAVAS